MINGLAAPSADWDLSFIEGLAGKTALLDRPPVHRIG
jgi:hypothetical protein